MKRRFPFIVVLVIFTAPVALAQNAAYSFDNFDTSSGVKIHTVPVSTQLTIAKPTLGSKRSGVAAASTDAKQPSASLQRTSLRFEPVMTAGSVASSLRGFTTGNEQVDGYIMESASRNGLDPLLIYSIMHQESSFKQRAISYKGARGLMQLMPGTAARYGVTNIFDPKQNIEGGSRYMKFLLNRFQGDLSLALAGYNAGEGAVDKYGWRIPPYAETQEYVRRISRRYNLLRDPNAAIYAPTVSRSQVARLNAKQSAPLNIYERSVLTVRLPDGRLQLMTQ
ncbi:MAG TPA: lytic transglycosylase domain-containing protein [Pyrinomonadaceae bacterium]|nr:lytic transglycosylase domain-containing protein [Pyrinomonadaceae bacterium]